MDVIYQGNVVLLGKKLGYGRIQKMIVDTETGEILGRWHEVETAELFPRGCNAVVRELMLSREFLPNGAEKIYISTPDGTETGVYFEKILSEEEQRFGTRKGTGKGRGRTRGKPGKIEIVTEYMKELESLGDKNLGFLIRLAHLARWDTGLVTKRNAPLTQEDISRELGVPETTCWRYMGALEEAGVVKKADDGGYYVDRKYIRKG